MGLNFRMRYDEGGLIQEQKVLENPRSRFFQFVYSFIYSPIKSGVFGFVIYFLVIASAKTVSYLLGISDIINLNFDDLLLSTAGFLYAFIFSLLKNYKQD
jgi:hypothetical protein